MAPLAELTRAYDQARRSRGFRRELTGLLNDFAGRPTPLYFAERLSEELGGARIFLKREDLLHTGAHKINNAVGQCLLTRLMDKERVVAETGAGQHGVATATAAAALGLSCVVYMGSEDMRRQRLNVDRMRLLGAEVVPVDSGSRTLKDAINEAMRDWVTNVRTTHYVLGSVLGPDPFPRMVRDFHRVIGDEARLQLKRQTGTEVPDLAIACVGGGSNAIGLFTAFLEDRRVRLIGVEAGGRSGKHGRARGALRRRRPRRAPRHAHLRAPGRGGADRRHPLGLGRPRLPGDRPRARLAARRGAGRVHLGHRRGGDRRLPPARPHRGDPARARELARAGRGHQAGAAPVAQAGHPRQPLGARRQGRRVRARMGPRARGGYGNGNVESFAEAAAARQRGETR